MIEQRDDMYNRLQKLETFNPTCEKDGSSNCNIVASVRIILHVEVKPKISTISFQLCDSVTHKSESIPRTRVRVVEVLSAELFQHLSIMDGAPGIHGTHAAIGSVTLVPKVRDS